MSAVVASDDYFRERADWANSIPASRSMMGGMTSSSSVRPVPGPPARSSAAVLALMARSPLDGYLALNRRYGDTIRVPLGPRTSVFLLSRPEYAEHVLAANQDNYVKAFTYRPLRALVGNGLLTSEGDDWRRHRRVIQPLFSRRDVAVFGPAMTEATQRMLAGWADAPDGAVLDVFARMSALALDVAGRALFSTDLSADASRIARALTAGQRVAVLATFVPLPWGPRTDRAVKAAARWLGRTPEGVEGPVRRIMSARRQLSQANGQAAGGAHHDLLDVMLAARHDGAPLTDAEIGDEIATFMLAGHETSANALSWSLALLSAYPAARERLEQEVDSVLSGREPDAADAEKLPYTAAVIAEALRLYPPAWTVERDALEDDEVAGVPVPAGSLVAVPPYLVHRHPEFWPDPAGFDPGRFLQANGTAGHGLAADRPRYSYIPFGGGRRACVGQSFAELETVLVLASIAQRYRLELTASGIPKPTAAVTLRPGKGGLPMRLVRRS
jgi:enediyne biosynthesis protein E7